MSERIAQALFEESVVEASPSTVSTGTEVRQVSESADTLKASQQPYPEFAIDHSLSQGGLLQKGEVLHSLFVCGTIGAALCNAEGKLVAISPAFAKMLDYQAGELLGTAYANLTHPKNRADIGQAVRETQSGGGAGSVH